MKTFYIYQLRLENSVAPFYIGKGRGKRSMQHFTPTNLGTKSLRSSIIKHARENGIAVIVEVLASGLLEDAAFQIERNLISHYGRRDIGTGILANHTDGGEGASGVAISEETKKKISDALKGRKVSTGTLGYRHTMETKRRMSETASGVPSGLKGRSRPVEIVSAISESKRNANPAWKNAGFIHAIWVENDKPSAYRLKKMIPSEYHKCDALIREFKKGWIPTTTQP